MVKKEVRKTRRKLTKPNIKLSHDTEKLNTILVENFVKLQKALTNITIKFDSLSEQISSLLQLFEISAKSFAEKLSVGTPDIEKDKEFLEKLNKLLEQNKVIAKGLTLMEEKMRERLYGTPTAVQRPTYPFRPRYPAIPTATPPTPPLSEQGYLPSTLEEEKRIKETE